MHDKPSESDWKAFRRLVPEWRELYLERVNDELREILDNKDGTATESFWDVEKRAGKEAKILRRCLNGHNRSGMRVYRHGMITDADLNGFSDELRASALILF